MRQIYEANSFISNLISVCVCVCVCVSVSSVSVPGYVCACLCGLGVCLSMPITRRNQLDPQIIKIGPTTLNAL